MKFLVVFYNQVPGHPRVELLISKLSFCSALRYMYQVKAIKIIFLECGLYQRYIFFNHGLFLFLPNCTGFIIPSQSGVAKQRLSLRSFSHDGHWYFVPLPEDPEMCSSWYFVVLSL